MIAGIGVDIVEIGKMKDLVSNYPAKINSIFTPREINFCRPRTRVSVNNGGKRFAAIFAAKEAALKSLGTGWERGRDLLDIEIAPLGESHAKLKNSQFQVSLFERLEERARGLDIKELRGSFSYSGDVAIAQVVALR